MAVNLGSQDYSELQSGIAAGDVGQPGSSIGDVDQTFRLMVTTMLTRKFGDKFQKIAAEKPEVIDQLILAAWNSPAGDNYRYYNDPGTDASLIPTGWLSTVNTQIQDEITNPSLTSDPSAVQAYVGLKDTYGIPRTTAETAFDVSLQVPVPMPFGSQAPNGGFGIGYDYGVPSPTEFADGRVGYADGIHHGVDYQTPEGTPIAAPFAGTIEILTGQAGYGNLVKLAMDDGRSMWFGHVAGSPLVSGMRVNPGDIIASSGANIGSAQGAVTLVEWHAADGSYLNPHDVLDPIFSGTTYSNLGMNISAVGQGLSKTQIADMRFGIYDTAMETIYSGAVGLWNRYFGRRPSTAQLTNLIAHGADPTQWEDYIRAMPRSNMVGVTVGQYADLRSLADQASQKLFGHPANDAIVKELFDQGAHSQSQVNAHYLNMSGAEIDRALYSTVYQANLPHTQGLYNDYPDPRLIAAQVAANSATAATPSQAAAAADALPIKQLPGENQGTEPSGDAAFAEAFAEATPTPPPAEPVSGSKPRMAS